MSPSAPPADAYPVYVDAALAGRMAALAVAAHDGDVTTPGVPILYGMRLVADVAGKAGWGQDPSPDIWLHESQSIRTVHALRGGEMLTATCAATSNSADATLSVSASNERGLVVETTTRLRLGSPELLLSARTAGRSAGAPQAGAASFRSVPLTADLVASYAELSGDRNPLHLDLAHIRSLGFPERIVHGMLLAAMIEPALATMRLGGRIAELRVRFMAPVYVGERVSLVVAPQPGASGRARIIVSVEGGPIACVADARTEG